MTEFIQGENRYQGILFLDKLDDYTTEDIAVRVIDVFVDEFACFSLQQETRRKYHGAEGPNRYHRGTKQLVLYEQQIIPQGKNTSSSVDGSAHDRLITINRQ